MPLIEKGILVEGENGETLVRRYFEREAVENPYTKAKRARLEVRRQLKIGSLTTGSKILVDEQGRRHGRKTAPDEKGYMWTMGYNHCSGTYSPHGRYSRFGGSSLNRNQNLKYDTDPAIVEARARDPLTLAHKAAKFYYKRCIPLPGWLRDYLSEQSPANKIKLIDGLSSLEDRAEAGIFLPIYVLSARSRGKIKDKATAFFRACPGSRVFCTLTFVATVDDTTGVSLLNKFLTALRKQFPGLQYLWVAERQENGNIHFHLILNRRIPIRKYNALWVMQQYNAGLRGQTTFGVPIGFDQVKDAYKRDQVHKLFNPVDVKKVRSIAGLSSYLTKYITKQKETVFAVLPWHCSRGVSKLFTKAVVSPSAFRYLMSWQNCKVNKETGEVFMPKAVRPKNKGGAFCVIVYVNRKDAPLRYLSEMETINKWMMRGCPIDRMPDIDDDLYRSRFCKN